MIDRRQFFLGAASAVLLSATRAHASQTEHLQSKAEKLLYGIDVPMGSFEDTVKEKSLENGGTLVVFNIGASWCADCHVLWERLDRVIAEIRDNGENVEWVRTDIGPSHNDEGLAFGDKWDVKGLPHWGGFYNGKVIPGSVYEVTATEDGLKQWFTEAFNIIKNDPAPRPQSYQIPGRPAMNLWSKGTALSI